MSYKEGDKFIIEIEEVYKSDLTSPDLYRVKGFNSLVFDNHGLNKLKKVEDTPDVKRILTDDEAEYLRNVIEPYRDRTIGVAKYKDDVEAREYIKIRLVGDAINLPWFEEGTMYAGMVFGVLYSPKELGI